jgi:hypothetical protein
MGRGVLDVKTALGGASRDHRDRRGRWDDYVVNIRRIFVRTAGDRWKTQALDASIKYAAERNGNPRLVVGGFEDRHVVVNAKPDPRPGSRIMP